MYIPYSVQDSVDVGFLHIPSQKSLSDPGYSLISDFCASTVGHLIKPCVTSVP